MTYHTLMESSSFASDGMPVIVGRQQASNQPDGAGADKGMRWEHIVMMVLGGAAVLSTGMLVSQWRFASVGRKVSGDVVEFLKHHGASVEGDVIVGGPVSVPMRVGDAVISTVDTLLLDISRKAREPVAQSHHRRSAGSDDSGGESRASPSRSPRPTTGVTSSRKSQQRGSSILPDHPKNDDGVGGVSKPTHFPEPVISGKTGLPISRDGGGGGGSGVASDDIRGAYPPESRDGQTDDDFSYQAMMPPGRVPPPNMP